MNYKRLLRDVIVAVLSAILTFLTTSCTSMWIRGNGNNPVIESTPKFSADSTSFIRVVVGSDKVS